MAMVVVLTLAMAIPAMVDGVTIVETPLQCNLSQPLGNYL